MVAIILVVLIVVLGVLYYFIISQSSNSATTTPPTQPTPTPVVETNMIAPPVSPTPSDEEVLDEELPDPAEDQSTLETTTEGL